MSRSEQLQQLILSYYREDADLAAQLAALRYCQISRFWFVLRIDCPHASIADRLAAVLPQLRAPIAELRLARHIKLRSPGQRAQLFPVQVPQLDSSSLKGSDRRPE
ncbi:hypothetical protein [Synechococcus elongatus]|uniref:Ribosomal protein L36 n=1 Tax=Synechococcus elongatus PCC 11802 TaxID=2283154 RepID=A0AAT9JVN6_SYNEL|nr:hypothetical protein [Synechococcus elongatus]QFZ92214.1 hypothetical protein EKO22_07415 [Synechococcus elongatus PCC 11802]